MYKVMKNIYEKYHTLNNTNTLFERFCLAPSRTILFWLIEYIVLGDSAIWSNHKTCTISSSISNNICTSDHTLFHAVLAVEKLYWNWNISRIMSIRLGLTFKKYDRN